MLARRAAVPDRALRRPQLHYVRSDAVEAIRSRRGSYPSRPFGQFLQGAHTILMNTLDKLSKLDKMLKMLKVFIVW